MNLSGRFTEFSPAIQTVVAEARAIADRRSQRGVIIGGCVRDLLLNAPVGDVDLMFEAPLGPLIEDLAAACHATVVSHPRFMTYTLKGSDGWKVDVVTARTETYPTPGHLPEVLPSTLEDDFRRRDFTINAMACWISGPQSGDVLDPLNGVADMNAKLIRALHERSFEDDPTRIYRAARFAGRFGFQVEPETRRWIAASIAAGRPAALTPVRRRHEFELLLKEKQPAAAFRLLQSWGALSALHPAWMDLSERRFELNSQPVLEDRLVEWIAPWGREGASRILTDLSFEKTVKLAVLSKLVQSRTDS